MSTTEITIRKVESMFREMPTDLQQEVEDFVHFLFEKRMNKPNNLQGEFKFDWEGDLADLSEQYSSVELQHKAVEWWGN